MHFNNFSVSFFVIFQFNTRKNCFFILFLLIFLLNTYHFLKVFQFLVINDFLLLITFSQFHFIFTEVISLIALVFFLQKISFLREDKLVRPWLWFAGAVKWSSKHTRWRKEEALNSMRVLFGNLHWKQFGSIEIPFLIT